MSLRISALRAAARRYSSAAEAMDKTAAKGPKLPPGNDPSASHGRAHAIADTNRWRWISAVFALPVGAYFTLNLMNEHEHIEAPIEYPYLKRANRVPRFPWGDEDLIGTSYERNAKAHDEGLHREGLHEADHNLGHRLEKKFSDTESSFTFDGGPKHS